MTRIAPTPSGHLHVGNAVNFLLTSWLARGAGGRLILRIDDVDAQRRRPEYLDDIFWAVELLALDIDEGPSGPQDFLANYSQQWYLADYRAALHQLAFGVDLYTCTCSRRELLALAQSGAGHACPEAGRAYEPGAGATRVRVPAGLSVRAGGELVDVSAELGDFVIWRRDDLPSYQLASVVDDRRLGVNAVVRGRDLLASSAAQRWLALPLGADRFRAGSFRHHGLLVGRDGQKLSKSAGAQSLRTVAATPGGLADLRAAAVRLGREVGIEPA